MPLVVNSLRGGHTHTRKQTHTHTDDPHRINFKKPGATNVIPCTIVIDNAMIQY